MSRVVHCKRDPFDVYVGRPGPWGNKFSHLDNSAAEFKCATREEAVESYEDWLLSQPAMIVKAYRELRGKVLGCWCAPKACHGDVLARVANGPLLTAQVTSKRFVAGIVLLSDVCVESAPILKCVGKTRDQIRELCRRNGWRVAVVQAPNTALTSTSTSANATGR